jgi:hypothetical protein
VGRVTGNNETKWAVCLVGEVRGSTQGSFVEKSVVNRNPEAATQRAGICPAHLWAPEVPQCQRHMGEHETKHSSLLRKEGDDPWLLSTSNTESSCLYKHLVFL